MAITPIKQPGPEVVQEIRNRTPNRLSPTLPGIILAPAYEVIELFVNGALNTSQAKYEDSDGNSYTNFKPATLAQTEFPGGHITNATAGLTNVAAGMVDMVADEIRAFVEYGSIRELAEHDTADNSRVLKGFLQAHNVATRPYVRGMVDLSAGGFGLDGFTLSVVVDTVGGSYPDYVPAASEGKDTVITFTQGSEVGGTLSAEDIVDQINSYVPNLAYLVEVSSASYLALVSSSYGANARVLVRDTGASEILGFHSYGKGELYSLGAGFRAKDDGDGDFESPFIELYVGDTRKSGLVADANIQVGALAEHTTAPDLTDADSYDSSAHPIQTLNFTKATGSNIRTGDEMYADGSRLGYLYAAQNTLLTLGEGPTAAAQSDIRKKEVNLQTHSSAPFAPRFVYFYARNLRATADVAAIAATADSISNWLDPVGALVEADTTSEVDFGVGLTFKYTATVDGVLSVERTHILSGSGTVSELKTAFNTGTGGSIICDPPLSTYDELEAVDHSTDASGKVALQTVLTGSNQSFTIGDGTANEILDPALKFATGTLTFTGNASNTETVTIGARVYTFNSVLGGANSILIGASASDSLNNLIAAITGAAGSGTLYGTGTAVNTDVLAEPGAGDTMDVTALTGGYSGNLLASTTTVTGASWSNTTLTGGEEGGENISENETYTGLDYHSITRAKGDSVNAWIKDGALQSAVDAVPNVAAAKNFLITAVRDNRVAVVYKLQALGNFGSAGPFSNATLDAMYNMARALNGLSQSSDGVITILTIDGDNARAGQSLSASEVMWHFQGSDEYLVFSGTDTGTFTAGENVLQSSTGATGVVVSQTGTGPSVVVIKNTSGTDWSPSATFTGEQSGATLATNTPQPRMAVSCYTEGSSNRVLLNNGDDALSTSIGFTNADAVRGTGIRPGGSLFFRIDQNPTFLATTPLVQSVQWKNKTGVEAVILDQLVEDMNEVAEQSIAEIYDLVDGGNDAVIRVTSNKVGQPSEFRIDPLGPDDSGNPGYVEIWNNSGTISASELGQEFDETAALAYASADTGKGVLVRGQGRPLPDFAVLSEDPAEVFIGSQIIRNTSTGAPLGAAVGNLYFSYRGLRTDITALQKSNGFSEPLQISNLDDLEEQLGPINDKNPLALGMRLALANMTNVPIKGVGVDEVDADNPDGTLDAWTRLLEYIQPHRIYAIGCVSQNTRIHDLIKAHVDEMSDGASRGERIAYFNSAIPSREVSTALGAGLDANSAPTVTDLQLESSVIATLQQAGVTDINNIRVADGVYLEIAGYSQRWNISRVQPNGVGSIVTVRTTFSSTENTDSFYTTDALPTGLVNIDWAVYKRGAAITGADDVAEAIALQGQRFGSRRINHIVAGRAFINLTGTEDEVSPAYLCAAYAGWSSQLPPQSGFTNRPLSGFTRILGTNDSFSAAQLDYIAGGGNFIIIQPTEGGAIYCRHQLTTDVSLVETQENSITRILDYVSYFMRDGVTNFIGTFNITDTFVDQLSTGIQGMLSLLENLGVIVSGTLNNIIVDEDDPTAVLVDITLEVPFPANKIRLTIAI